MAVVKSHVQQFLREVNQLLDKKLDQAAEMIFGEAQRLMKEPKSGVDYRRSSKSGKPIKTARIKRKSSAPGEAPAVQTRDLYKSLTLQKFKKSRRVGFPNPKILWLEQGTRSIAPRPLLRPALENKRAAIKRLFGVKVK